MLPKRQGLAIDNVVEDVVLHVQDVVPVAAKGIVQGHALVVARVVQGAALELVLVVVLAIVLANVVALVQVVAMVIVQADAKMDVPVVQADVLLLVRAVANGPQDNNKKIIHS